MTPAASTVATAGALLAKAAWAVSSRRWPSAYSPSTPRRCSARGPSSTTWGGNTVRDRRATRGGSGAAGALVAGSAARRGDPTSRTRTNALTLRQRLGVCMTDILERRRDGAGPWLHGENQGPGCRLTRWEHTDRGLVHPLS